MVRALGVCAAVALGIVAGIHGLACGLFDGCGELEPVESGEYVITEMAYGYLDPDDEWVGDVIPGAQLSVDRTNNTATIRYVREGTLYEVRHKLE
jgi:hypothetical protein